jgi:quercetin dioxygenase-like cupin family protein
MKSKKGIVLGSSICVAVLTFAAYAAIPTILAVGTIGQSEALNGPATLTVRQFIITPGEVLQWHHHPGLAFNVVKHGTLTLEDGCGGEETLLAGQAFEEVHARIHRAKNLTASNVEVYNTFVTPDSITTINTTGNQRLCGPPLTVTDCKQNGWAKFTFPRRLLTRAIEPVERRGQAIRALIKLVNWLQGGTD